MSNSHQANGKNISPNGWIISIAMVAVLLIALGSFQYSVMSSLFNWWGTTSKFGHSILIFPIIAYLVYERKSELAQLRPTPQPALLIPLLLCTILLTLFNFINIQVLSETLLIAMIPLSIWLLLGTRITRMISIPLLLLFTTVPVWELFSPQLTELTANAAHICLKLLNVPVLREGGFLTIPEGVFEIAEGCGGFRYFIVGLTLGLIFSYTNFRTATTRTVIISLAIFLSIIGNWLRVMVVIWAGHVTNMQHPYVHEHVNLGWYIFAAIFFIFFFIANRFSTGLGIEKPVVKNPRDKTFSKPFSTFTITLLAFTIIGLTPNIINDAISHQAPNAQYQTKTILSSTSNWSGPHKYHGLWKPTFEGATGEEIASYQKGKNSVTVYIAYYRVQTQHKELINYNNSIINSNWGAFINTPNTLNIGQDIQLDVNEIENDNTLVWFWYYVAGSETADKRIAKVWELKKLISNNKLSAVIAIMPNEITDKKQAKSNAENLLKNLHPHILDTLNSL